MLTREDKKWVSVAIRDGVVEALEQVVFPEFQKLEKKMATKDDIEVLKQQVADTEERLSKGIDRVSEVLTETKTNHERRIRKLEETTGVEPSVRLTI